MSLLDDARRLAADCPIVTDRGGRGECHYCGGGNYEGGYLSGSRTLLDARHEPSCPWLSMPKIVAALEAAERINEACGLLIVDKDGNVCVDEDLIWSLQRALES